MPSEPSAEAREKCRETLFAIMVTRGSVDQMLDAIIPIIERDTANRIWEEAKEIAEDFRGDALQGEEWNAYDNVVQAIRSRISGD